MLDELALVLAKTKPAATLPEISATITDENILSMPTSSSRIKSYKHLVERCGVKKSSSASCGN